MKTYSLKEISKNMYYGKMPSSVLDIGPYPIFTGYKISGYSNEFNLDKDEVVVIARGVGGTGDVKLSPQKCFLSNIAIAIIADEKYVLKKYLYYYFQVNSLRYLRTGSAQPQITIKDLENARIDIPSIEIQQQVLDCLEPIDKKISLNNALNDNLEEQGRLLVKQYGTKTTNLVPLFEIMNFDNGFPFQSKTYLEKGRYKIITIKNVTDGKIDTADSACIDVLPAKMKSCCKLKIGDVLLSLTGNVGRVGIVCESNLLLNQRVAKINPYNSSILPYLYFVFRQPVMKDQMILLARGTAQANLSPIETLKINIPFQEETAVALSSMLLPLFNQIVQNYKENNVLMELRDCLLPRLLNGQIVIED